MGGPHDNMPKTRTSKKTGNKKQRKEINTPSTSENVPAITEEEKKVSIESLLPEISENDMQRGRYLVNELSTLLEKTVSASRKQYERYSQSIEKYFRFKFKFYGFKAAERRSIQSQWLEMYGEELINRGHIDSFIYLYNVYFIIRCSYVLFVLSLGRRDEGDAVMWV